MSDAYYDSIAACYNELHGEEQLRKLRLIHEYLSKNKLILPTDTLLDVGCGTGLSASIFKNRIQGVEPSKAMAHQAPFPVTICAAEQLPFPNNAFDVVLCITAVHNMVVPEQAIKEMQRVSRKLIIISVLKKSINAKRLFQLILGSATCIATFDDVHDKIFILAVVHTVHATNSCDHACKRKSARH